MSKIAGRGATGNAASTRLTPTERDADGDWLDAREAIDGAMPPLRTSVTVEHPKTILTTNRSPDVPFDRSVNPYRGCDQLYTVACKQKQGLRVLAEHGT